MTTIRPAAIGARLREGVLTLYYPLLPRQPRICNHQLSRRPPRHWPPSAIPRSTLHSRASHVSRSALPSRPDLGGIHLIPTDAAQTGAARQQLQDFLALPPAGHHDLHGPGRRRARLPGQPGARLRGATPARSRHHRPGAIAGPGQRRRRGALEREILLAMLGSPVPFPFRPCPSWSPPSASAAASSRPRARPPWPSTPSTPSAPRAIGPTTKNAASPSCPAARSSKACAAPRSPRPRASSTPSRATARPNTSPCWASPRSLRGQSALARDLQRQWETRAVMSGRFHDTFLHEYGSLAEPLPHASTCRATGSGSAIRTPLRPTWKAMKAPGCSTWAAACSIISGNATSPSR